MIPGVTYRRGIGRRDYVDVLRDGACVGTAQKRDGVWVVYSAERADIAHRHAIREVAVRAMLATLRGGA